MADMNGPGGTGRTGPEPDGSGDDLERRRRELDAKLAVKRPAKDVEASGPRTGGMAGMGKALRLSSEFIAGIVVGAAIGWFIDTAAGTTPWGLVVFLLLGFAAGVLNVLRSAGVVAERGVEPPVSGRDRHET